ncbi:MAG: ATP-binding protein [Chloroflexota bacterium]
MAREEGESLVQSFHASMAQRGGHLDAILRDICALANTNGGTIYIGLSADPQEKPEGVKDPTKAVQSLQNAISKRFSPEPMVEIDSLPTQGVKVVRINVQAGPDIPYAIDYNLFYVRDEDDTSLAVRDEIVGLVEKNMGGQRNGTVAPAEPVTEVAPVTTAAPPMLPKPASGSGTETPRTGVEIVETQKRDGTLYHTLRDMRNGNLIKNVTRSSARRLWHYAITQAETNTLNPSSLKWRGNMAIVNVRKKGDTALYDLALRDGDQVRVFYGVSENGLGDAWVDLVEKQGRE